jgi:hypothetical protein
MLRFCTSIWESVRKKGASSLVTGQCVIWLGSFIGGAERLIVDVALAFKSLNHNVEILTSHHDPKHCFEETMDPSKGSKKRFILRLVVICVA